MIELQLLSGKMAGKHVPARRFPFSIGRSENADLRLDEAGVWPAHARMKCDADGGLVLEVVDGSVQVNGQPVTLHRLKSGDVIRVGTVELRFAIAPARQKRLLLHELAQWAVLAGTVVVQLFLIWFLAGIK